MKTQKSKLNFFSKKKSETIFMILCALFPLAQFILFYVCVNANQIILAFKDYKINEAGAFVGLDNFKTVLHDLFNDLIMRKELKNSLVFSATSFVTMSVSIMLAFFWWKKVWINGFIKILALLPNLLSGTVFVMIYRYTVLDFLPGVFHSEILGELLLPPQSMRTILVIGLILSVGPQSILFFGSMNGVSQDVVEYSRLDGFGIRHEFFKLIWPTIYPTFISYTVLIFAGFFTGYGMLVSFFSTTADYSIRTIGYEYFVQIYNAVGQYDFPYISAGGIIFTLVTIPVIFTVKYVLEKIGPKED